MLKYILDTLGCIILVIKINPTCFFYIFNMATRNLKITNVATFLALPVHFPLWGPDMMARALVVILLVDDERANREHHMTLEI
jgi:hypothetical protein